MKNRGWEKSNSIMLAILCTSETIRIHVLRKGIRVPSRDSYNERITAANRLSARIQFSTLDSILVVTFSLLILL